MNKSYIYAGVAIVLFIVIAVIGFNVYRQSQISEAERLLIRGEYESLIEQLEARVSETSGDVNERAYLGEAYYRMGDSENAFRVLEPLLRFEVEDPRALEIAGWMAIEGKSYIRAQDYFKKIRNKGKEAIAEAGEAGIALMRSEGYRKTDLSEAELKIRQALSYGEEIAEAYLIKAQVDLIQNRVQEAVEAAERAAQLKPRWFQPQLVLGRCYLQANKSSEAREAFQQALELGAPEEQSKYYLAKSIYLEGRLQEALDLYEELIGGEGETARSAMEDSASIYLVLQQDENAIKALQKSWQQKSNPQTGMKLYEIYSRLGRDQEAERILDRVLAEYPFITEAQLEKGNLHYREGELDKAYAAYQNVLNNDSENYWALYNSGCIALLRGDYFQAPDFFNNAVSRNENFFPAQVNHVLSLIAAEREADAYPLLQQYTEEYPGNSFITRARALERFSAGETQMAEELMSQSLEDQSTLDRSYLIQGEIALRSFEYYEAQESFEKTLELKPESLRAKLGLAHTLIRLRDYDRAKELYQDLFEQEGLSQEIQLQVENGLALANIGQGNIQPALDTWSRMRYGSQPEIAKQFAQINSAVIHVDSPTQTDLEQLESASLNPAALPESLYNYGLMLGAMGQEIAAQENYVRLLEKYPNYLPGLFNLAEWYREHERTAEAARWYSQAHKVAPERIDVLNNHAATVMALRDYEQVERILSSALQIEPNSTLLNFNRALLALQQGRMNQVTNQLQTLQKRGTDFNTIQMIQGLRESQDGNWTEAVNLFQELSRSSDDPYAYINYGIALAKNGQYQEAERMLEQARRMDSSLAAVHKVSGILYCKMGLYEEALRTLKTALAMDSSMNELGAIIQQITRWMEE